MILKECPICKTKSFEDIGEVITIKPLGTNPVLVNAKPSMNVNYTGLIRCTNCNLVFSYGNRTSK